MDRGVKYTVDEIEKSLLTCDMVPELSPLKSKIIKSYHKVKNMNYTGDLVDYLEKFKDDSHKDKELFDIFKNYGLLTFEELYHEIKRNFSSELVNKSKIEDLVVGEFYSNYDITNHFKCSEQGGMRKSNKTNTLVLVSDHTNPLYEDKWENDILNYTGMGRTGDMDINYMQNKTLNESNENDVDLFLFEVLKMKALEKYLFKGEVTLVDDPFQENQLDADNNLRSVWMFPIKPLEKSLPQKEDIDDIANSNESKLMNLTDDEVEKRSALFRGKSATPSSREVKVKEFNRNPFVKELTLRRAKGVCERCGSTAPFITKNGRPYLEVHHKKMLSEGGEDTLKNTIALCPNCHRELHYG